MPPVVDGKPCHFFPTSDGTLYFHPTGQDDGMYGGTTPTTALGNPDRFFDWVYVRNSTVYFRANHSIEQPIGDVVGLDWFTPSAYRNSKETHVLIYNSSDAGLNANEEMAHFWWSNLSDVQMEILSTGFHFEEFSLQGYGDVMAIGVSDLLEPNRIYITAEGAFQEHMFPGLRIFDVDVGPQSAVACAAVPGAFVFMEYRYQEAVPAWVIEPVRVDGLAPADFDCDVTVTESTAALSFTNFLASGALGGAKIYVPDLGWQEIDVGQQYHNGMDMIAVGGCIMHMMNSGNGSATGNDQNGTEIRTHGPTPLQGWHLYWDGR